MASRPVSPSLTRSTTATDSTGNLNLATATWTLEQEARLGYCQGQLKQAQKKWSDRQELWIREVILIINSTYTRTHTPPPIHPLQKQMMATQTLLLLHKPPPPQHQLHHKHTSVKPPSPSSQR